MRTCSWLVNMTMKPNHYGPPRHVYLTIGVSDPKRFSSPSSLLSISAPPHSSPLA